MRHCVGYIAIFLGSCLAVPLSLSAQDEANQPSAEDILRNVRAHYSTLTDYHFRHQLTAAVETAGEKAEEVAKVDFELAVAGAKGADGDPNATTFPTSMERCRMSVRSKENSMILVSDGQEAVLYLPKLEQFKRATSSMRAIGGPTSATFFLVANILPIATFTDAQFERPKIVRNESLEIGDRVVQCHVIEAQIERTPQGPPDANGDAPAQGTRTALAGSGYLMFLGMHGLTRQKAMLPETLEGAAAGQPLTVLLWVDQRDPKVWKSELREPLTVPDSEKAERTLVITDTFATIQTKGPLAGELFRFEIAEGAQEVEKIGQP